MTGPLHGGEDHSGAEVVVARVGGCILHVDTSPNDGGLVAHHIGAAKRQLDIVQHPYVEPFDPLRDLGCFPVSRAQEGVDSDDVVTTRSASAEEMWPPMKPAAPVGNTLMGGRTGA